jgi:hypothetical protein
VIIGVKRGSPLRRSEIINLTTREMLSMEHSLGLPASGLHLLLNVIHSRAVFSVLLSDIINIHSNVIRGGLGRAAYSFLSSSMVSCITSHIRDAPTVSRVPGQCGAN